MKKSQLPPLKKSSLEISYRPIDDLIPYARNARTHSDQQIAQIAGSIREFGWTNPVLIDETGGVIAGHGRILAARKLAMDTVPVITLSGLSQVQKRALVLADNKLALNAGWDDEMLRLELLDLRNESFDLGLTGFDADEINTLLADANAGLTDPDDAPEAPADPVSVLGDVWLLGKHRLVCGDCTDASVVEKALNGVRPHLMVTDPPYGVEYDANWRNTAIRTDGSCVGARAVGKVSNDCRSDWRAAWRLFPGSVVYVWHGGLHHSEVSDSLIACSFKIRAQIVWVKTRPVISRGNYHWQHEPLLHAVQDSSDDHWRFVPEHEISAYAVKNGSPGEWRGGRKQSTVWFIEHLKSGTGHSTQKPVECMQRPIENNSSPGQAVYDPFVGSGTTIIAGEMTGRSIHACELNPAYIDVAVKRWQDFTGQHATLDDDGRTFDEIGKIRHDSTI
jgi:DNA modification methylase